MTLRRKLQLAQLPWMLALLINAFAGQHGIASLQSDAQNILQDNYLSVLAAQHMKECIERLDSSALFVLAEHRAQAIAQTRMQMPQFEQQLRVQENNVTEDGEAAATTRLRQQWDDYLTQFDSFLQSENGPLLQDRYFEQLLPRFTSIKSTADTILALNQDAMVRKSDGAKTSAQRSLIILNGIAVVGCILGLLASGMLTTRLLRPLSILGQAVRRFGEGDLPVRARVQGGDEIAHIATDFNVMADRLQQYRESSLGELLETQQAAQAAIDSLSDPVLVMARDGRVQHVNHAAESLLQIAEEAPSVVPATVGDAVRSMIDTSCAHVFAGKGAYIPKSLDHVARLAHIDGDRYVQARAAPIYAATGLISGCTVVLHDVTRLLRVDELKNDLVATVAHELRTPLTSLRLAIHMCVAETVGPLNERQADLLFAARDDCERLQAFVEDLLDLSRIQEGRLLLHPQWADAERLVNAAVTVHAAAAAQRDIRLRAEVLPDTGQVYADIERTQLVFGNLLNNAVRHSASGASIIIRAHRTVDAVRFEVTDEGPGIAPEFQRSVFDKYTQGTQQNAGAVGLGLFISKEIVAGHGGHIGVDSQLGHGATFWFTLPLEPPAQA